jgi:hypothetical protein
MPFFVDFSDAELWEVLVERLTRANTRLTAV